MTTYHEIFFFYILGYRPSDVIRDFGYNRSVAYRWFKMYREARKKAINIITQGKSVSLSERNKLNNRGALKRKKRVPQNEKWETVIDSSGTVVSRKVKNEETNQR